MNSTHIHPGFDAAALEQFTTAVAAGSPPLFAGATIHTADPLVGTIENGDLLLGIGVAAGTVVGVGTGLVTATDDDGMVVLHCGGLVIVPAVIDVPGILGARKLRTANRGTLAAGAAATFAVLRPEDAPDLETARDTLLRRPEAVLALVVDGEVARWGFTRVIEAPQEQGPAEGGATDSPYLGTWIDETGFLHQMLTVDGRYDETRDGREHAFQGRFWITGDRIEYLDDLGFWAYGDFIDGTLHHGGYVLHR
ncbi:protein Atu4866 [Promicromonospora umidemergens]|uniref:Ligand-binding protein with streptavidin-like fold n=1 Tax=Promicromonospora umidemergens TaxID=629679 RepID=A0ABP8XGJ7_9MICO|nr:Atu4866 domain-containing protein [Promicromonospora umidemergens]MCP2282844.1 protein Atu4866 [Promicromonospora umidemergens]